MNYHLCSLAVLVAHVMYACGGHRTYNTAAALSALSRPREAGRGRQRGAPAATVGHVSGVVDTWQCWLEFVFSTWLSQKGCASVFPRQQAAKFHVGSHQRAPFWRVMSAYAV
jgi:hypothetical protein